ncbi:MAG: GLPGLI family protein [Chryseobacterium sp.]|nr:GLPGLI family protein [Chryseobacterium sp.]
MKIIMLFCFFIGSFFQAQTHRYIYELQLKMDSTENEHQKFYMILDVNKNETKFYGRNLLIADSLNKKFGNLDNKHVDMTGQVIKRKNGSSENENFSNIKFGYYSYKTTDIINWKIENETKKYNDYSLQKATADFGGRHWIAWFNKDIPFNEGPYKFRGLPGLIFEIQDDKNNFIYKLVKNQNFPENFVTDDFLESNFGNKAVVINEKQKRKLLLDFYNDPFSFERTNFKNNPNLNINIGGKQISSIEELNGQVKNLQNIIRKYNNPVEADKAINYN